MAVADQVLVSAAHFIIGLSVARTGSTTALGLFGLGFLLLNSAADIHRALIWLPMSHEAEPAQYRTARRLSILLGAALAGLALLFSLALLVAGKHDWAALAAAVAVAVPFLFAHEIQRRIQFALLDPARALVADLMYVGTASASIVFIPAMEDTAVGPAIRALLVLALAAVTATGIGFFLLRKLPPSQWSIPHLLSQYGPASRAYAVNAGLVFGTQRFSMLVLVGVLGVDAFASVEAGRLLTAPLMVAALGLAALTVPSVSHALRHHGAAEMRKMLNRTTLLALAVAGIYGATLLVAGEPLSHLVFNRVFDHAHTLGLLFCGIAATSLIATTLVAPLGLAGHARAVPQARLPGVLLVVVVSFPAALFVDEHAVLGLVLVEGVMTVALLRRATERLYSSAER